MEAKEHPLNYIIGQTIYKIPFFQRSYVWNDENWESLWEELTSPKEDCFLGSVILKKEGGMSKEVTYKMVVDGQQRLTTLTLLLRALNDYYAASEGNPDNIDDDYEGFLYYTRTYRDASGKHKVREYKIEHSRIDAPVYKDIIDGKFTNILDPESKGYNSTNNLVRCYKYFREQLANATPEEVNQVVIKLTYETSNILVFIELKENEDEQAIFDTINSAGVKLTTADIIKNALYQRLLRSDVDSISMDAATKFYNDTWKKTFEENDETLSMWLENKGIGHNVRSNIDIFFHTFAIIKDFFDPSVDKVSELATKYKEHIKDMSLESVKDFIIEICDYAKTYADTFIGFDSVTAYSYDDWKIRLLQILNTIKLTAFDPFILHAIKTMPEDEQRVVFRKLECFVMRNYVVNNTFRRYTAYAADMIRGKFDIDQELLDPDSSDERVEDALKSIDNRRASLSLFWIELYRHMSRESDLYDVDLKYSFELEHIMPQKWETYWGIDVLPVFDFEGNLLSGDEAKKVRNRAVYEIGNMTLLKSKLNKELQNFAFAEKVNGRVINRREQKGMKAHTAFSITKDVVNRNPLEWNEQSIRERTSELTGEFLKLWPNHI